MQWNSLIDPLRSAKMNQSRLSDEQIICTGWQCVFTETWGLSGITVSLIRIRLAYGAFSAWRVRRLTCFTDGKSCDSDCNSLIKVSVRDTVNIINCALDDLLCIHEDPFEQQALILDLSRAPAKQRNSYFPFYHSQMNAQQVLHTSELFSKLMFVFELFCTIYTKYVWSDNILFCSKQREKEKGRKTSNTSKCPCYILSFYKVKRLVML